MTKPEIEMLLKDYKLIQEINLSNDFPEIKDEFAYFHPKESFVILSDDEYVAGIRCNHLIVIKGFTEDGNNSEAIMVIGNHKGGLIIKFFTK